MFARPSFDLASGIAVVCDPSELLTSAAHSRLNAVLPQSSHPCKALDQEPLQGLLRNARSLAARTVLQERATEFPSLHVLAFPEESTPIGLRGTYPKRKVMILYASLWIFPEAKGRCRRKKKRVSLRVPSRRC